MKIKTILLTLLFSLLTAGCQVTSVHHVNYEDELSRYEAIVVAKSVLHITPTNYNIYDDEYSYYYDGELESLEIGYLSFVTSNKFNGYHNHNPYLGSVEISLGEYNNYNYIYLDVIDEYFVYITLYDYYGNAYDSFRVTWSELGY